MRIIFTILVLLVFISCKNEGQVVIETEVPNAHALDGTPLFLPAASLELMAQYHKRKSAHITEPDNVDALIWHGRYAAYTGDYKESIQLYSQGILSSPNDARLYRHRGHRYITTRQYDKAIIDLSYAAQLIQGQKNEIEPDGMPNVRNIPVSTLHGNIYYHLGLAYYLKGDLEMALGAYLSCLESSEMADNLVSSTHWLYMILRKLGRDNEAAEILKPIQKDFDIIENMSYYKLCLFYKGVLEEKELLDANGAAPANDAVLYGLASWYDYNNQKGVANTRLKSIVASPNWNSFGFIAAEADLFRNK